MGGGELYLPKLHMAKASPIIKYLFYDPRFWTAKAQENRLYYPRISLSREQRSAVSQNIVPRLPVKMPCNPIVAQSIFRLPFIRSQ